MKNTKYYSLNQVATMLKIHPSALHRKKIAIAEMIAKGKIPGLFRKTHVMIDREYADALIPKLVSGYARCTSITLTNAPYVEEYFGLHWEKTQKELS